MQFHRFLSVCLLLLLGQGLRAESETSTKPAAQLPVEAFARLPLVSHGEISPDGKRFAFFSRHEGRRVLVTQNLADGKMYRFPGAGEMDYRWLHWANDERIVFALEFTGDRQLTTTSETRLMSGNWDGTDVQYIVKPKKQKRLDSRVVKDTLPPPQIKDKVIDWSPSEPHHILVAMDEDFTGDSEIRRIDVRNGEYELVHEGRRGIQNWMADQQGEIRLGWGYDLTGFKQVIKRPGGWVETDDTEWGQQKLDPIGFDVDPRYVFALGAGERGVKALKKIDLQSGAVTGTVYAHPEVDVDGIVYDPVTGRFVGVAYTEHERRIHYIDAEFSKLQRTIDHALPGTVNEIASMSKDRQRILVLARSDNDPGVYYLWDRSAKKMDLLAQVVPALRPESLSKTQALHYKARDGMKIPVYVTLPLGREAKNLPTIMMPHGGPHARTVRGYWYLRHFLANRGYAVVEPNFRGSTGYGEDFENAGRRQWGGKMQEDVIDGVRWMIEQGMADPKRIAIVGWSYGGYAAAMAAVQNSELFQGAASINGVLDLAGLVRFDKQFTGGRFWSKSVGLEDESLKGVSPIEQADKIKVPMLIVHAKDDARVPHDQAVAFVKRLQKLNREVSWVEVESGGHSMDNEVAQTIVLNSLQQFLGKVLGANAKSVDAKAAKPSN